MLMTMDQLLAGLGGPNPQSPPTPMAPIPVLVAMDILGRYQARRFKAGDIEAESSNRDDLTDGERLMIDSCSEVVRDYATQTNRYAPAGARQVPVSE